jgi:N-acetylneuraminate synthase
MTRWIWFYARQFGMNIIAEIGNAHEGSLLEAEAYIRAVAAAGAWGVKFQYRDPDSDPVQTFREGTKHPQDATRRDYWERVGFSGGEWVYLVDVARECNIQIGVSVFAANTVRWAVKHFDFLKVPGICANDPDMCNAIRSVEEDVNVFVSVGPDGTQAGYYHIDNFDIGFLHLVAGRPSRLSAVFYGFDNDIHDGISSHSPDSWTAIKAAEIGCQWFETHVIWSRSQLTPDASSSLTVDELEGVVRATY